MGTKRVVVIASGETERRALPHLVTHLATIQLDVRIPKRNAQLNVQVVNQQIAAAWWETPNPPDKFVVLADVDGKTPDEVLTSFRAETRAPAGVQGQVPVLFAYAQWHLEAWYFADAGNLREYLGHAPGDVDTSLPDQIENPKNHLKHLLTDRVYTAQVSEEIARKLDAETIAQRSPSFRGFLEAVMNGDSDHTAD